MRRFSVLVFLLFAAGCSAPPMLGRPKQDPDVDAACEYVQSIYADRGTCEVTRIDGPEYAAVDRIPWGWNGQMKDKSAACAVRIWFTWRFEGRTTRDHWLVWVSSDHKAVGW